MHYPAIPIACLFYYLTLHRVLHIFSWRLRDNILNGVLSWLKIHLILMFEWRLSPKPHIWRGGTNLMNRWDFILFVVLTSLRKEQDIWSGPDVSGWGTPYGHSKIRFEAKSNEWKFSQKGVFMNVEAWMQFLKKVEENEILEIIVPSSPSRLPRRKNAHGRLKLVWLLNPGARPKMANRWIQKAKLYRRAPYDNFKFLNS